MEQTALMAHKDPKGNKELQDLRDQQDQLVQLEQKAILVHKGQQEQMELTVPLVLRDRQDQLAQLE
jgi:hypothetical protein